MKRPQLPGDRRRNGHNPPGDRRRNGHTTHNSKETFTEKVGSSPGIGPIYQANRRNGDPAPMNTPAPWANIPHAAFDLDDGAYTALAALHLIPPGPDGIRWATATHIAETCRTKRHTAAARLHQLEQAGWIVEAARDWHRIGWRITPPADTPTVRVEAAHIAAAGIHLRTLAAVKSFNGDAGCFPSQQAIAARLGHEQPDSPTAARKVRYHLYACRDAGLVTWRPRTSGRSSSYTFPKPHTPTAKATPEPVATRAAPEPQATQEPPATPTPEPQSAGADPHRQHLIDLTARRVRPLLEEVGQTLQSDDLAAIAKMLDKGETSKSITRATVYACRSSYWRPRARPSQMVRFGTIFEQARGDRSANLFDIADDWDMPEGVDPFTSNWDSEADGWGM